ncbi:MAG: hypothetical protein ACFCVH_11460 [Alphaproteobacteria bacterium]
MIEESSASVSAAGRRPTHLLARLAQFGGVLVVGGVLIFVVLSYAWPSTWSDRAIEIGADGLSSECYAFSTPRLMIVDIRTTDGAPVAVGIVPSDTAGSLTAGSMASHTVAGAYAPSLAAGRIDVRIDADRDYCVVIYGAPNQLVETKVRTYLRLW